MTAKRVANSIVKFCNEYGDLISNLKLQKLLYYAQAWHLAIHNKELFPEDFKAWVHGPVVPSVYHAFKEFGCGPILRQPTAVVTGPKFEAHLAEVMGAYGGLSGFDLERLTHSESPWRNARGDLPPDQPSSVVISKKDMKQYYKAKLGGKTV